MPQVIESVSSIEQLSERVRGLEERVAALEGQSASGRRASAVAAAPAASEPVGWGRLPSVSSGGTFPIIGRAVLGFAGAFLLRAITESTSFPKLPVLAVAILYACFWMVWAVRTYSSNRFASITYAITSVGILCPMIWETTVRFEVLPVTASAVVLVGFLVMTMALADRLDLQLTPWITTLSVLATVMALIIATHELVPLTCALLAVAVATETNACVGHVMTFRAIPALVADFGVWLTVYVLAAESVPEAYRPASAGTIVAVCALLPVIYGASVGIRSFVRRQRVTVFEVVQAATAFVLGTFGISSASHGSDARVLGAVYLGLAAICYWGTLLRFTEESYARNRRIAANAAAAFLLAATFLLLPEKLQVPFLCVVAVLVTTAFMRTGKLSLGVHVSYYVAAAVVISPLPLYVASAIGYVVPGMPEWRVWAVLLTAAICYGIGSHRHAETGKRRLLWVVPAGVVASTVVALAIAAIVSLIPPNVQLQASHLAMIRTIVVCAMALSLGVASRARRMELGWVAYAVIALGTLKLVVEDLRYGSAASLVVSFLFYGVVLILLPRMTRRAAVGTA